MRVEDLVPSRSDVSACYSLMVRGFSPSMLDVSAEISHHCDRMCSCLDGSLPSLWRMWLQPG